MKKRTNLNIYFLILTITFYYLFISKPGLVLAWESGAKTSVSAQLPGKFSLRLFGYASPFSLVQASSFRVFAQTSTEKDGYFLFREIIISSEAKEICLSTIDAFRRVSFPLCLPLPETDKPREIGPLILAPTLSLSQGKIWQGEKIFASGQTLPESPVWISFFEVSSFREKIFAFFPSFLPKKALAFSFPLLETKSDKEGYFSFTLPTAKASSYRFFARVIFEGNPSLKSHTLTFSIGSFFSYLLSFLFPKILIFSLLVLLFSFFFLWERKNQKIRLWLIAFNEKKLKPFGVRKLLQLRRLMYNLRGEKK